MEIKLTAKEAHELFADVGQLFPEKKREAERQFYLIQRATRYSGQPSVRNRLGLSFDYMGSAEFEFGALGRTWKRFQEKADLSELGLFDFTFVGQDNKVTFWAIAPKTDFQGRQFLAAVVLLSGMDAYSTRETTHMNYALGLETPYRDNLITAWHTIESRRHDPVFWTTDAALASHVWSELHDRVDSVGTDPTENKPPVALVRPVLPEALSLFDVLNGMIEGRLRTGLKIIGIYDYKVKVKTQNDQTLTLPYTDLRWPDEQQTAEAQLEAMKVTS